MFRRKGGPSSPPSHAAGGDIAQDLIRKGEKKRFVGPFGSLCLYLCLVVCRRRVHNCPKTSQTDSLRQVEVGRRRSI